VAVPDSPPVTARSSRRRRARIGSAARLAALHALVLAAVLGASVVAMVRNSVASSRDTAAGSLAAELRTFRQAAVARAPGTDLLAFTEAYLRTNAVPSGDAVIVAVDGRGTVGSPGAGPFLTDLRVERALADPPSRTVLVAATVARRPTELLVAPLVEGGRRAGTFLGTGDLSMFASEKRRVLDISLIEAALALMVGVSSAYLLLRRLLRTVGRITRTADRIGQGRLDERLGDQGTDDEVAQLAESFDAMLDRVESAVGAQRRLLSDVSHQLRTPMTVARGHLEVLARTGIGDEVATRETIELVVDELEHMRGLVERLSMLGHAMEPGGLALDVVDLPTFLSDLYDACAILGPRRWVCGPVPDVVLDMDAPMMRGALLNLADNAVQATRDGDALELSAAIDPSGRWLRIGIGDSGPGIAPEQRAAVLDRFSRPGARPSGGSGLGLAIVKAVAEAHGGAVEVGSSIFGGARVTLVLPVSHAAVTGDGVACDS